MGGILFVAISGFSALNLPAGVAILIACFTLVAALAMRIVPPLSTVLRRALVTPFVVIAGGLFWNIITSVTGVIHGSGSASALSGGSTPVAIGFLVLFSAVYYVMLVYAPRQVAHREGGLLSWLLRYTVFVISVLLGIGWARVLG